MKLHRVLIFSLAALTGCRTLPGNSTVAGIFASNPVRQNAGDYHWVDGRERVVTRELTLTLYPNGIYGTGWREYFDGKLVRFSGLATYDLQTNSTGTWAMERGKLVLRSTGPASSTTAMMLQSTGRSITPEESQADISREDGHWVIVWKDTKYFFRMNVPNQRPDPTLANGPGSS